MTRTPRTLALAVVVVGLCSAAVHETARAAPSANDVVDKVQHYYADIQHLQAQFHEEVTNSMLGTTQSSDGTLWIMKPSKMRADYLRHGSKLVKKSFISNGSQLWIVEHDNKQVIKKDLQGDLMPVAVSFLYGKGDLKTEFDAKLATASKLGGPSDLVLELTPKTPSTKYKTLVLVVSSRDFHVTQSELVDASNNATRLRFYAPDTATTVPPTLFELDERFVPKTYRIVSP